MSYANAAALQLAVYERLRADAALGALVGDAVYDALPVGALPATYVSLGPEEVRDRSDREGGGAEHRFSVSVLSEEASFARAKAVAAAVEAALGAGGLVLGTGRLVGLWFERARAVRTGTGGQWRRIDLRFRARVENS